MTESEGKRAPFRLRPWQSGHPIEVDYAEGMVCITVGGKGDSRVVMVDRHEDRIALAVAILPPGMIAVEAARVEALQHVEVAARTLFPAGAGIWSSPRMAKVVAALAELDALLPSDTAHPALS